MRLRCLDLVAAFLLGVSSAVCTRQPPTASMHRHVDFRLPACLVLRPCVVAPPTDRVRFARERSPAPDPVVDARLGLV